MAPKKPQAHFSGYIGTVQVMPTNLKSSSSSRGRQLMESSQLETSNKSTFKDVYGKSSTGLNKAYKAGEFVDKSTGRVGYMQEMKYTRTDNYDDKEEGYTHEYQTQVKYKHVAYPYKGSSSSTNKKNIDYY